MYKAILVSQDQELRDRVCAHAALNASIWQTDIAPTASEAVRALLQHQYDLVICSDPLLHDEFIATASETTPLLVVSDSTPDVSDQQHVRTIGRTSALNGRMLRYILRSAELRSQLKTHGVKIAHIIYLDRVVLDHLRATFRFIGFNTTTSQSATFDRIPGEVDDCDLLVTSEDMLEGISRDQLEAIPMGAIVSTSADSRIRSSGKVHRLDFPFEPQSMLDLIHHVVDDYNLAVSDTVFGISPDDVMQSRV